MKQQKVLILPTGIPGSGKSTWCKSFANDDVKIVSRDAIRFSKIKDQEHYFSKEKEVFREFVQQIKQAIADDTVRYVVADQTNLTIASRKKLLNALQLSSDIQIWVALFEIPLEVAIERNNYRTGLAHVPEDVITKMYLKFKQEMFSDKFDYADKIFVINEKEM